MTTSPVNIIARREVRDILGDWRILVPMIIMVFLLPQVIVAASAYALNFIGDNGTVTRLIPFAMLLVGFIPASFSLIAALESFVGERERNSLEALLAMPISDAQLYMGKLLAALIAPLGSALGAMTVFCTSLLLFRPRLFYNGLSAEFIILAVLLIVGKALVMVAAAVIISSHTTSVRAANLLASFVLIPTASILQLEALLVISQRTDVLWWVVVWLAAVAFVLVRTGLGTFNREEILSREHEQLDVRSTWRTFRTFLREFQPAGVAVADYTGRRFALGYFYHSELPALLREYRLPIGVALFAALVGLLGGSYVGQNYRVALFDQALANVGNPPPPGLGLGLGVGLRNAQVGLLSNLFSLFALGIFAFLVPSVAFAQVAFVATTLASRGESAGTFLLGYVVPHGSIELPTAILSAAMGLRLGVALLVPPAGFSVGQNMLWALAQFFKVWLFVLVPLFIIAGLVEGLISPRVIAALYG